MGQLQTSARSQKTITARLRANGQAIAWRTTSFEVAVKVEK